MIVCEMKQGDDRSLQLHATDMNEMIEKIKEWQSWEDNKSTFDQLSKSEEYIQEEKESGWYFID